MTSLFVGIYGLFLVLVGVRGNAGALTDELSEDAPQYLPWLIAIVVLALMSEFEGTKTLVKPFALLLLLNFGLSNFETIQSEVSKVYNLSMDGENHE